MEKKMKNKMKETKKKYDSVLNLSNKSKESLNYNQMKGNKRFSFNEYFKEENDDE